MPLERRLSARIEKKTRPLPASFFATEQTEKLTDRRSFSVTTDCDAGLHPRVSSHVFNSRIQTEKNTPYKPIETELELSRRGEHDVPKCSFFSCGAKPPDAVRLVCDHIAVVTSAKLLLKHNRTGILWWRRWPAGDCSHGRSRGTGASMNQSDMGLNHIINPL